MWNEGKEEEIKKKRSRARERVWLGVKKNNRKPADSNGAPANPPEIKQPAATSPSGSTAPLHFSFINRLNYGAFKGLKLSERDVTSAPSLRRCAWSEVRM